jgi:tRNA threonylcarbamoyladenosine biosynthesis protein TsaE
MEIIVKNKSRLPQCAKEFLKLTSGKRLFAFSGPMGAGKTTIIKAICKELGATDVVTSPTFTLINEYRTLSGESIYHIDFYRIKKPEEVFDFGLEEYLSSGLYCFMEWPELVEGILPAETLNILLTVDDDEKRLLNF